MFGIDKTVVTIAIDSTSKPFWTTGDVITGSIRVLVDAKLMLSGIQLSLVCNELGAVSHEERLKEARNKKKPKKPRGTVKKTVNHFKSHKQITEGLSDPGASNGPIVLEPGEYVFPFEYDLEEDINSCPPHSPIRTRGDIDLGVTWQLRAVVRRWSRLHANTTATQLVPIYPRNAAAITSRGVILESSQLSELSGSDPIDFGGANFGGLFKRKKKPASLSLEANLKFPSREIPQGPKPLPLRLFLRVQGDAEESEVNLHTVSLYILRTCNCRVRARHDEYLTSHLIGSVTASRKVTNQPLNLTNLMSTFGLKEVMPSSFSAELISVKYALLLRVEYSSPVDSKLRVFELQTPTEIAAPYFCWTGPTLPLTDGGNQVTFNEPQGRSRSIGGGGSINTGNSNATGTTGATGSSAGTVNSYNLQGPTELLSNWVASWRP